MVAEHGQDVTSPTCLIFGATGQDGCCLAEIFRPAGFGVVGISRRPLPAMRSALGPYARRFSSLVGGFVVDPGNVRTLIDAVRPAVIVNVAGMSSVGASFGRPMETFLDNGQLNLFVLEALRRTGLGAHYVFASSGEVFGETPAAGAGVDSPIDPRSPYAVSKAAASLVLRNYREVYGVRASIAYLFPHESPLRDTAFVLPKVARSLLALKAGRIAALELGRLDVVRDWGWAPEFMRALFLQAQLAEPVDLVIAGGTGVMLGDMVRHGMRRIGIADDRPIRVDPGLVRRADLHMSVGATGETARVIGWRADTTGFAVLDRLMDALEDDA
ncbi:MAG: GDP-mannose 4,6-dehydratase [Alphaproteobacteria bacterium]|nr:GDP-mannose 4,6-dehydratase [Alphaproteobacteria bacterium]